MVLDIDVDLTMSLITEGSLKNLYKTFIDMYTRFLSFTQKW